MKILFTFLLIAVTALESSAQKYSIDKSKIVFFSDAAIEDITATNKKASGLFNPATAEIAFSVNIQDFQFEKSLMQEHFNEKYMESDKFPKSTFTGRLVGFDSTLSTTQNVKAVGRLTMHGVTKDVELPGTVERQKKLLVMKSKFIVRLVDYNIAIPQMLWQKIAEQIEVTADFSFKPR